MPGVKRTPFLQIEKQSPSQTETEKIQQRSNRQVARCRGGESYQHRRKTVSQDNLLSRITQKTTLMSWIAHHFLRFSGPLCFSFLLKVFCIYFQLTDPSYLLQYKWYWFEYSFVIPFKGGNSRRTGARGRSSERLGGLQEMLSPGWWNHSHKRWFLATIFPMWFIVISWVVW